MLLLFASGLLEFIFPTLDFFINQFLPALFFRHSRLRGNDDASHDIYERNLFLIMFPFQTLCQAVFIEGVGLHSGATVKLGLLPRQECGLVFKRTDLPGAPLVSASARHIGSTLHATRLQDGEVEIATPEHLLAALWSLGVTHCTIELDGPEIPILDGSARLWCELITSAGLKALPGARPEYSLREPIAFFKNDGAVIGLPHASLRVTCDVEFGVPYLETQAAVCEVTAQSFSKELAPARTFTLESWLEPLRAQGLIRGGSTDNALVLGKHEASSPLRFENELARHKALDALGDIALLFGEDGGVLHAHIIAIRAGHEMHRLWMREVVGRQALLKQS